MPTIGLNAQTSAWTVFMCFRRESVPILSQSMSKKKDIVVWLHTFFQPYSSLGFRFGFSQAGQR